MTSINRTRLAGLPGKRVGGAQADKGPRRRAKDRRQFQAPRVFVRRDRWRAYAAAREAPARATAPRQAAAPPWSATCEEFAAVLPNWPVAGIERGRRLCSPPRRPV